MTPTPKKDPIGGAVLRIGDRIAVVFEGTIANMMPSKTPGVWFIVANGNEAGEVLRVALTDAEMMEGGLPPSVEVEAKKGAA